MPPNDAEQFSLLRDVQQVLADGKIRGSCVLNALPDLVFSIREDGTILDFQAPDERDLILPPERFLGKDVRDCMPPHFVEKLFPAFDRARATGDVQLLEYSMEVGGKEQWYECRIVTAGPDKFLSIVRNITRSRQTLEYLEEKLEELRETKEQVSAQNKALRESELFSRQIIESSNDCIKILDLDGNLLYINPGGERVLEMTADDHCIGSRWLEFWGSIDRAILQVELDKARAGLTGRFQGENPTFRGTLKWWDVMISPITGIDGTVERLLVVSRDITEHKITAEKLLRKESFFRSLIENNHDIITVMDLNGRLIYESPSSKRVFGYEPAERVGVNCFDLLHSDDREYVATIFRAAIEHKRATELVEYRYRHKDGSWVWVEVIAQYSLDEAGEPVMVVNKRDITDRRKAQEKLRETEERLYSFINNCPAATWITDDEGVLLYVNSKCYEALKLLEPNMIGKSMFEVFPKNLAQQYYDSIKLASKTGFAVQNLDGLIRGDGTMGSFMAYRFPITDSQPGLIGGFAIDITDQRQAERQLLASEEKYRNIVDTMLEGIWILDAEHRITFVNSQLAEMLGYKLEELIGRPTSDFMVDPADSRSRKRTRSGSRHFVATLERKDKTLLKALVSARPTFDETGKLNGSLAILMDATDRMRTHEQLEQLTARLLNLQDEERRRIARELHDGTAQNLAAINFNISTLRELSPSNGKVGKIIDEVQELTDTSLQEIRTLSYLLHPPMLEETGLAPALQWFIGGYSERTGIRVELDIHGRIGRLSSEIETALYRIIQEGLTNVYRHSGSTIAHVSLTRKKKDVFLTIRDEGRGMSDEAKVNHGVGISSMKERLRLLGGSLEIDSNGSGTAIKCTVPIGAKA